MGDGAALQNAMQNTFSGAGNAAANCAGQVAPWAATLDGVYLDRSEVVRPIKPKRIGWFLRLWHWLVDFTGGEPAESAAKRICDALQEKRENEAIATPYYFNLDGHRFCWTGWKVGDSPNPFMFPELKTLAGQWSVVSPADKNARLYSSYPGGEGVLVNWLSNSQPQVDLTPKEHQVWPDTSWTAKQLKPLEEECLSRLRVLVAKLEPVSSSL